MFQTLKSKHMSNRVDIKHISQTSSAPKFYLCALINIIMIYCLGAQHVEFLYDSTFSDNFSLLVSNLVMVFALSAGVAYASDICFRYQCDEMQNLANGVNVRVHGFTVEMAIKSIFYFVYAYSVTVYAQSQPAAEIDVYTRIASVILLVLCVATALRVIMLVRIKLSSSIKKFGYMLEPQGAVVTQRMLFASFNFLIMFLAYIINS